MHFIKRKVLNSDSNFSNIFPTGRDHFGNERQRANGSLLYQVQQQSGTKPNLVAKFWLPNLVFCTRLINGPSIHWDTKALKVKQLFITDLGNGLAQGRGEAIT